jgi:hypothetical protein
MIGTRFLALAALIRASATMPWRATREGHSRPTRSHLYPHKGPAHPRPSPALPRPLEVPSLQANKPIRSIFPRGNLLHEFVFHHSWRGTPPRGGRYRGEWFRRLDRAGSTNKQVWFQFLAELPLEFWRLVFKFLAEGSPSELLLVVPARARADWSQCQWKHYKRNRRSRKPKAPL